MSGAGRACLRVGFTLLETLLVLAVIGLVSMLVLVAVGRDGPERLERGVVREVERALLVARVEAMQRGEGREVRVVAADGEFEIRSGAGAVRVRGEGLRAVDGRGLPVEEMRVLFDADGRTGSRLLRFLSEGADGQRVFDLGLLDDSATTVGELMSGERSAVSGAAGIGGRLWLIRFDPVSGVPVLEMRGGR